MVEAWSDGAEDTYRLNLSSNRPSEAQAADHLSQYYRQRVLGGRAFQQEASTVLGTFVSVESVAVGFPSGLRFLSLMMLTLGLTVALLLRRAARGLHAISNA